MISITIIPHGEVAARFDRGLKRVPVTTRPGATIGDLIEDLGLPAGEVWLFARNGTLARAEDELEDGDTLEIVSPVAGGAELSAVSQRLTPDRC